MILPAHGPGTCSLITGLATAMMDSSPRVVLIGTDGVDLLESQASHEADAMGITRAITKYTCAVKDVTELERNLREAFHVAATGRPGPVVVDLSADLSRARTTGNGTVQLELPGYRLHRLAPSMLTRQRGLPSQCALEPAGRSLGGPPV